MTSVKELDTPSNTLKAADLDGDEVLLTIKSYEIKEFEQTGKNGDAYQVKKPIFSFEGTDKRFVCNKTNMRAIAYAYGDEMDDWVGKPITLYPTMVSFGTEQVEAIRVRVTKPGSKGKPKFMQSEAHLDDEIPF